jgi:alanine racemase
MELLKRTWAVIDLDALTHNYETLRAGMAPGCRFLGVVKADAYGHGAVPVSRHLRELGADFLAVSNLEEAVQLRQAGQDLPILILGYTPPQYAPYMAEHGIRQEVNCLEYAQQLSNALAGQPLRLKVHLKIDTGMSRLGFFAYDRPETMDELVTVCHTDGLEVEGMFAHFAVADSYDDDCQDFTALQFSRYKTVLDELTARGLRPEICHCCNSAATILHPEYHLDMVRPGIATYGMAPDLCMIGAADLRPLMSLRSTIAQIKPFPADISVSYGRTYYTDGPRTIAVVPMGYADGYPRLLSGKRSFLLHGKEVPQVGRVCMDMCMVDITDVPEAKVGDTVTIFGRDGDACISLDDLASQMGTISYELLCAVSKRVPRLYKTQGRVTDTLQYIV